MLYSDDPTRDAAIYEARMQAEIDKLPKCDICGEPIQGDYLYDLDGTIVCEECLIAEYRKDVDEYV